MFSSEHNPLHKLFNNPKKVLIVDKDHLDEFLEENTINGEHRLFANCEMYDIKYQRSATIGKYKVSLVPA